MEPADEGEPAAAVVPPELGAPATPGAPAFGLPPALEPQALLSEKPSVAVVKARKAMEYLARIGIVMGVFVKRVVPATGHGSEIFKIARSAENLTRFCSRARLPWGEEARRTARPPASPALSCAVGVTRSRQPRGHRSWALPI